MAINEVFDDEFTKSRRGLLIIFSIGLLHQLLGIGFIDAKISIPGLPEVVATSPENLTYAYMMLVLYATYRYVLNSGKQFSEVCRLSFSWGVNNFLTRWYFSKVLTNENMVVVDKETDIANDIVRLNAYDEQNFLSYSIGFKLNGSGLSYCWVDLMPTSLSAPKVIAKPLNEMWGLYESSNELSNDEQSAGYTQFSSHRIRSIKIRFTMHLIIVLSIFICFFRKPRAFDYWTPVILNITLLIWLCFERNLLTLLVNGSMF